MSRLIVGLTVVFLLSGCELLKPVTAKEARAETGLRIHRTDVGGYYRYDGGGVEVQLPPSWRHR